MIHVVRRLPFLALFFIAASIATAQEQPLPRIDESIEVSLANVDVVVTDKQGNRVRGLTRDDFELLENGVSQPITNFADYAAESQEATVGVDAAPAIAAPAAPATQPRMIVIFAESFVLAPFHARPYFNALRESVRRMVRPGDSASIVMWADAMIVRQEFTDDVKKLEAALDRMEREGTGVPGNPAQSMRMREDLMKMFEGSLAIESFDQMNEANKPHWDALDNARFQLFKIRQKTFALTSLMQRMSAHEGKKIVLLSSQRFGEHAGVEFFGGVVPGEYRALLDTSRYRRMLTSTANAYGVTIYPVYVPGIATTFWGSADTNLGADLPSSDFEVKRLAFDHNFLLNELRSLEEIARETGGMMQWSSKEVVSLLPKIAEDLESYYSLGWRVNGRRTGAQKIVVRTKNPQYVVRARRELAIRTDEAKMEDRVIANLYHRVPGTTIPIEAKLGRLQQTSSRRWTATLQVRIPIKALAVLDTEKGAGGTFQVYVAPGAVFGLVTDVQRRSQAFTVDVAQLERARKSHFTYEVQLKLDHLVDRIGVGVLDETSKEYGLITIRVPERKTRNVRATSRGMSGAERAEPEPGSEGWSERRRRP